MHACKKFHLNRLRYVDAVCDTTFRKWFFDNSSAITPPWLVWSNWKLYHAHLHILMHVYTKFHWNRLRNVEVVCDTTFSKWFFWRIKGCNSATPSPIKLKIVSCTSPHPNACMCKIHWNRLRYATQHFLSDFFNKSGTITPQRLVRSNWKLCHAHVHILMHGERIW